MKIKHCVLALVSIITASSYAGTYGPQNFDKIAVGKTVIGDGSVLVSTNPGIASIQKPAGTGATRALRLSATTQGSNFGAWKLPQLDPGGVVTSFDITFKCQQFSPGDLADGFSVNFGAIPGGADAGGGEQGFGMWGGMFIAFDTFNNAGDAPQIRVVANGAQVGTPFAATFGPGDSTFHTVVIHYDKDGLDMTYDGAQVFQDRLLPGFAPALGDTFAFSARTGGVTQDTFIDDVTISTTVVPPVAGCGPKTATAIFDFTGGLQTFTVPVGVTHVFVEANGAQGGTGQTGGNASTGGAGGLGSRTSGILNVTPGQILNVFVGGQGVAPAGGFNGGGNGGSTNAGGGGGASDIRLGGTDESNRILVAGGGGGGGRAGCFTNTGINGGAGGGANGANGTDSPTSTGVAGGGRGATQATGGAAGIGCSGFLGQPGGNATTGTGATGGAGQTCCCGGANSIPGGGGGGGGFLGGGGGGGGSAGNTGCTGNDKGAGGGGAGGSNFADAVFIGAASQFSVNTGNGSVRICFLVAQDDTAYIPPGVPTLIDVKRNDPIDITNTATLEIATPPQHGTATVVDGKIRYTPTGPLPPGGDTFQYNFIGTATVTVLELTSFAGTYDGFAIDPAASPGGESHARTGFVRVTLSKTGAFTGTLHLAGRKLSPAVRAGFSGSNSKLEIAGDTARIAVRLPEDEVVLRFQLNSATGDITGTMDSTANMTLGRQTPQGARAGLYTLLIDRDVNVNTPRGTGFAAVKIGTTGLVSLAGKTADGAPFACASGLHADATFPLYAPLYKGKPNELGSLRGTIEFSSPPLAVGVAQGFLVAFKPARPKDKSYATGFALSQTALLARFNPPVADSFVLSLDAGLDNGGIAISDGAFSTLNSAFTLTGKNIPAFPKPNADKFSLKLNVKNGTFTGAFLHPTSKKSTPFAGALIQDTASGAGFFVGPGLEEGGRVNLGAP